MSEALSISPTEKMIARKEGPIGWIIFNNPERRNAVSVDMWEAIPRILDDYESDEAIRVIVLRGAGEKAFVSGADISQFEKMRASAADTRAYDQKVEAATTRISECMKPTIAMVYGWCMGGGVSIAMSCDLRLVAEGGRFGVPAAKLGVGYQPHALKKLLDVVGPSFTKEIFFTARPFSAEEALAMGWINRVVPVEQLDALVRDYAETIGGNAPLTIRAVKQSVKELLKNSKEQDLSSAIKMVEACFGSEDYVEGRRAFMEKRKPEFKGR
ncbi:MAG: enoyl-CoA hydratase [Deltaproteobacteria bacterium]|nr:enoyl-CoA hydratase [Deltaproteobacteria bacterium]